MYMAWLCILSVFFILVIIYHWNKVINPCPTRLVDMCSMSTGTFDDLTLRLEKLAAVPKRHFCTGLPWQADISAGLHSLSTRPDLLLLVPMFSPSGIYSYNLVDTLKKKKMRKLTVHFEKDRPEWPGYIEVGDKWMLVTFFEWWCSTIMLKYRAYWSLKRS